MGLYQQQVRISIQQKSVSKTTGLCNGNGHKSSYPHSSKSYSYIFNCYL